MEPHRGVFGGPRPAALGAIPLPPDPMPSRHGLRPLKAWRYVAVLAPELMACACLARIGPSRQGFWAVWDRRHGILHEGGRGELTLVPGAARIRAAGVELQATWEEEPGIETVCPCGEAYAWTRKQGGNPAQARTVLGAEESRFAARVIVDDTAGYYPRHTRWRWSAGVGETPAGRPVAWNLVAGVNDPVRDSERTVWIDGTASEPPPSAFAPDLAGVDGLRFAAESVREQNQNRLLVRSRYRQPFGTFSGSLPDGTLLATGLGVMEDHDVWW